MNFRRGIFVTETMESICSSNFQQESQCEYFPKSITIPFKSDISISFLSRESLCTINALPLILSIDSLLVV